MKRETRFEVWSRTLYTLFIKVLHYAASFVLFYGDTMSLNYQSIVIVSESLEEKEYLENHLLPKLQQCFFKNDFSYSFKEANYCRITLGNQDKLLHAITQVIVITQNFVSLDYDVNDNILVYFELPKTIEENVTET